MHYLVTWDIDIDADNPQDASKMAREMQLDSDSVATVFKVEDDNGVKVTIDLEDISEKPTR
jgi:hypothetical protein